jgi:hypothetical protein
MKDGGHMQLAKPFQKMTREVLELTEPPPDVSVPVGAEAIAVGLLMRARVLLRANALLADRLMGGAADPLARSILEACITAAWLLADDSAYETYLGHYRRKWRVIAEGQQGKVVPLNPEIRAELDFFRDRSRTDIPPEADSPPFDQQAEAGGFEDFYSTYRMITRRAHPDLDAAHTGLIEDEKAGGFRVNPSPIAPELAEVYVKAGIYLVAKLGKQVDERLAWGRADQLGALLGRLGAESKEAIDRAGDEAS